MENLVVKYMSKVNIVLSYKSYTFLWETDFCYFFSFANRTYFPCDRKPKFTLLLRLKKNVSGLFS